MEEALRILLFCAVIVFAHSFFTNARFRKIVLLGGLAFGAIGGSLTLYLQFRADAAEREKTAKIQSHVERANELYNTDEYKKAFRHFKNAISLGSSNGIVWYRLAYSSRQIEGFSEQTRRLYNQAYQILRVQYPEHRYRNYAERRVSQWADDRYPNLGGWSTGPGIAENGDLFNRDNDGDGRIEPVYVEGYFRSDGTYVRGHYRAKPR